MSEQTPQKTNFFPTQQVPSFYRDDEIDLLDLFKALWRGKWVVLITTALFAIGAVAFAFNQPNIYQAQASFVFNNNIYGLEEAEKPVVSPNILTGNLIKGMIASQVEVDESLLRGVGIAFDKREQLITVSKTSASPDEAFQSVELVYHSLNAILKQVVLAGVLSAVDSAASLKNVQVSGKVQESVAEIYAQQLYKKAVLENPSSELIQVVNPPVKPTSHIKPKRALISVLGTLLGGMFGVAMVLIRFAFRKDQE